MNRQPKARWLRVAALVCLFLWLLPLHDKPLLDAQTEYLTARADFLHGQLERGQDEAAAGYRRYRSSGEDWPSKFTLLEAEILLTRGRVSDVISLLATYRNPAGDIASRIEELTMRSIALTRLHQYGASMKTLSEADGLCASHSSDACGGAIKAHALLALEQGDFRGANQAFKRGVLFGQSHKDPWLEVASMAGLSASALQQDHFDESLNYSQQGLNVARSVDAENSIQVAKGNIGWAYFKLGDSERALELLNEAEQLAHKLGNTRTDIRWLMAEGYIYQQVGDLPRSLQAYRETLPLAEQIGSKTDVVNSLELLAHLSVQMGKTAESERYIQQLTPLIQAGGNRLDVLDVMLAQAEVAVATHDDEKAKGLLHQVEEDPGSQLSMRFLAGHELAKLYEAEGNITAADQAYKQALAAFLSEQNALETESSKLPFMTNAVPVYDDYIHFLVAQQKPEEALAAADQIRARTLEQGLGISSNKRQPGTQSLQAEAIARKTSATLLFYWLGEKQSYLWAITPRKTVLYPLPSQREISSRIERYRKTLLGPSDPLDATDEDGRSLYRMLVAPAKDLIRPGSHVVILADGALSKLNFETLIVQNEDATVAHYWIEDATLLSAPSLLMLQESQAVHSENNRLLLLGDAISPRPEYPELPMSATEMSEIEKHFAPAKQTVFSRAQATTTAYLRSAPEQYGYIHFVTHAIASDVDPLDSAILLSRDRLSGDDSFKLYARQILQHPIHANLVTISACYGSGKRSYAGEGLVGLSWAFLRAGAHNVIGALWEVDDGSTPDLMGDLYQGLETGLNSSDALHQAKLKLLRSGQGFSRPYYWAPFQLYSGL